MAAPVAVEEYPCTWIRLSGKRKKKMPMAEYKNKVSRFAPVKLAFLNMASRTIGEVARASTRANPIMQPKPAIKLPKTRGFLQPRLADSIKPFTIPPSPRVASNAPSQSTRSAVALRLSGIRQRERAITAAARGRLMKNAHRQEACSTSQPPRTGPTAVVIAVKPDHVPIAWPRLFSSKDLLMIARLPGTSSAAPTP